jgi:hypothetical protein
LECGGGLQVGSTASREPVLVQVCVTCKYWCALYLPPSYQAEFLAQWKERGTEVTPPP